MRKVILLSGAVLLLVVLVTAWNLTGVIEWDGSCFRELRILVLDTSAQPIAGAKVAFVSRRWELLEKNLSAGEAYTGGEESLWHPSAETDGAGRCQLRAEFPASGTQTRLGGKRGSFDLAGQLDVERPGAQRVRIPLSELVGGARYSIHHHSPTDVTVRLEAGAARDGPEAAR